MRCKRAANTGAPLEPAWESSYNFSADEDSQLRQDESLVLLVAERLPSSSILAKSAEVLANFTCQSTIEYGSPYAKFPLLQEHQSVDPAAMEESASRVR